MNNKTIQWHMHIIFKRQFVKFFLKLPFFIFFILLLDTAKVLADETLTGYQITSPVSGLIKQVYAKKNKTVKRGELLLEFNNTLIDSNLSAAESQMKLAKINLAEAKKELDRANELYQRTVLSEHDLQLAKILYAETSARFASAKNQLIHAQWNREHSKLYAPFNGRIMKVFSYQGQYVNSKFTAQTLLILKKIN